MSIRHKIAAMSTRRKKIALARAFQAEVVSLVKNHLMKEFGGRKLSEVTSDEIRESIMDLASQYSGESVTIGGLMIPLCKSAFVSSSDTPSNSP